MVAILITSVKQYGIDWQTLPIKKQPKYGKELKFNNPDYLLFPRSDSYADETGLRPHQLNKIGCSLLK